ncbi:MAG: ATP-dependent RNA helicase HrpA [Verrucomicrobia bacterium]|nr:ATP-dependent RNA helicase HrpA [Verrucomicrobiota bacterium]
MREAPALHELKRLLPQCLLPDQVRLGRRLMAAMEDLRTGRATLDRLPLSRWLGEARASIGLRERRRRVLEHLSYPPELPITARKDDIVAALRSHRVVVVAGETGSGKTTQLPKMCLEAGLGLRARIGCTQPRRVAALSISRRLAEELQVEWGREVGCQIRFDDQTRPETSVKVMTDGILLAEVQGDPLLSEYEVILLDEAHERSLNIDFLLGYLKLLLARRDDLKLVITSATIDTERFAAAFGGAPVIEVSGRLFPVEVRYRPLDAAAEEAGEITYIDAAVAAVEELLDESPAGDALVFMPGERDIRETCELLAARRGDRVDVIPLYGRLTAGEQQSVFAPGPRRRVVVATNIAETSVTVPRIRYVVDTGLARISRYHAPTRTNRLPVEPIAQSSANQRKGRCGRVADGICVRLYSEEDFNARPRFQEPEIQRCDLADVILRLKAHRLGEVESFPFIDPPSPGAISGAYQLLQELGALDDQRVLTPLGRELARLPVDPAIGRMLLEARQEGVLPEVLVIAAGLSIQDPRERPAEQRDAAEAAHRRFQHPQSDFLTLLNIWRAYHDTWDSLKTQSQMRKFCKAHFLSYLRMREWREIHAQLEEAMADGKRHADRGGAESEAQGGRPRRAQRQAFDPDYAAIHRAVLTGLLGHVAQRAERNLYAVAAGRQAMVFPGSALFDKGPDPSRKAGAAADAARAAKPAQPAWLVAGEIMETSRTFLRTVAAIDPEWVIELAPHVVRVTHENARWDARSGRVLATEKVRLRGLVLRERAVGYGRVNAAEATRIFIRSALVEEDLDADRYPFIEHNRRLREKIELWQTRLTHRVVPDLDEALAAYYAARLKDVSSLPDLNRALRESGARDFLCAREGDLLGEQAAGFDRAAFPDAINMGDHALPVQYAYAPGEERDGITVRLAARLVEAVDPARLEWAVPALREERVAHLLRELPKPLRRALMPLAATAREVVANVAPEAPDYLAAASEFIRRRFGLEIPANAWAAAVLPEHLRPRYEVVGSEGQPLAAGRDLEAVREAVRQHTTPAEKRAWDEAVQRWERYELRDWDFGELPERVMVSEVGGLPLHAFPGLEVEDQAVNLRLFRDPAVAAAASRQGVPRLAAQVLHREVTRLQKDLRSLRLRAVAYAALGGADQLLDTAWKCLERYLFPVPEPPPRTAAAFVEYVTSARGRLPGAAARLVELAGVILELRHALTLHRKPFPGLAAELDALVPADFLERVPFDRLTHLPRYLRAMQVRADRAAVNPAKDAEKAQRVRPFVEALRQLAPAAMPSPPARPAWERLRWLVEEFKVSVFAQELGTAEPVSPKKLEEAVAAVRSAV